MSALHRTYDVVWRICNLGGRRDDSDEDRIQKAMVTLTAAIIAFLAIFWGSSYVLIGRPWSGAIPLGYAVISFTSIGYFFLTKQFRFFRFSQLFLILMLPFLLMWSLGGFSGGSVVMVWAFFTPLAALLFVDLDNAWRWLGAYLGLTVVSGLLEPYLGAVVQPLPETTRTVFFILNMGMGFVSLFIIVSYFVKGREETHQEAITAKEEALRANAKLADANRLLEENEAQIRQLMLTDALTGLANRRHLNDKLNHETGRVKRYERNLTIVICDIDHFKAINDRYGHNAGDEVIKTFARIIQDNVRNVDFASRFGGEEFVMLLPETDPKGAGVLAHRIREELKAASFPGVDSRVSASFGIAAIEPGESGEQALQRADQALYESKNQGRDRVSFAKG